ncbi:MAG: MFS transporter [Pseudomonadota bacterium]
MARGGAKAKSGRAAPVLPVCCAVSAVLGSVHAFSVFLPEWEQRLAADRAGVSLVYSLALVALTTAVLLGYRAYRRWSPARLLATVGWVSGLGLLIAARAESLASLYVGYGLVFGAANGLGYGYTLQLAGQVAGRRRGVAMATVTACYAVGATVSPLAFTQLITVGGNAAALQGAAVVVAGVSLVAAAVCARAGTRFVSESASADTALTSDDACARTALWVAYGTAVLAGLMVIGHAFALAQWKGLGTAAAAWATTTVAAGNMLGGFAAGPVSDRVANRDVLIGLPLLTAGGLVALAVASADAVFLSLGVLGFSYGALIAVYPVAVSNRFGTVAAPRVYGQVFTAWGVAGLLGPWASGWVYVQTGTYTVALSFAVVLSGVSAWVIWRFLPRR